MRPSEALAYKRLLIQATKAIVARSFDFNWQLIDRGGESDETGHTPDFRDQSLELSHYLPQCPTYFVSADMTAVAKAAGRSLPSGGADLNALPSHDGFMAFGAPIATAKFTDGAVPVEGVAWELDMFTGHRIAPADDEGLCCCPDEELSLDCRYTFSGTEVKIAPLWLHDGQMLPLGEYRWHLKAVDANGTPVPYHEVIPALDMESYGDPDDSDEPVVALNDAPPIGSSAKAILAAWMLMQQSITEVERTVADRPERRRSARVGLPPELVIVRLRRIESPGIQDDEESAVPWSHRWLVGGHWRQQFYPSTLDHRTIWISPYVKGPEGKPLIIKEKVTAWVR